MIDKEWKIEAEKHYGKKIVAVHLIENEGLRLNFEDGKAIRIFDGLRDCCERRYLSCDDNLSDLVGKPLIQIEIKDLEIVEESSFGVHEIMFLQVKAGDADVTLSSHNEHNGYYGGIDVRIEEL